MYFLIFFAIECRDDCNYYYSHHQRNYVLNCPKGHSLIESKIILNASDYIRDTKSQNLIKGYLQHEPKNTDYSVRSIKSITYRLLHLIIHSNFYMLNSLAIYDDSNLKTLLNLEQAINVKNYLRKHIEKDYEAIKDILCEDEHHFFVHAVLYRIPGFLRELKFTDRDRFEEDFEKTVIDPLLVSVTETINCFKNLLLRDETFDEVMLMLNETVFSPKLILFLTKSTKQSKYNGNLKNFLEEYKLREVPGDVFCFAHCLIKYFEESKSIYYKINDIKKWTLKFYKENKGQYDFDICEKSINDYFNNDAWNTDFAEKFTNSAAKIFKINICILETQGDFSINIILQKQLEFENNLNFASNLMILVKQADNLHYSFVTSSLDYPFSKHMRVNKQVNYDLFKNRFINLNMKREYPLIYLFIKNYEKLKPLSFFPKLISITNYLWNRYNNKLKRYAAQETKLSEAFEDKDILNEFLKTWNEYFKDSLSFNSPLSILLIDNDSLKSSCIDSRRAIENLSLLQNKFLDDILEHKNLLPYLENFNVEPILIHQANENAIITIFDMEECLQFYSLINPKYGSGMEINFEYGKIQIVLQEHLLHGKRFLDNRNENIRTIQYVDELFDIKYDFICKIRKEIRQEHLENMIVEKIHNFIDYSTLEIKKSIFSSLDALICHLNNPASAEKSFKDFINHLNLDTISSILRDDELFANLHLKNFIEVYEIFEIKNFNISSFNEKYKTDLGENGVYRDFLQFISKLNGKSDFITKNELSGALKKLSMRCLFSNLDEKQELILYLGRLDFWPYNYENKINALKDSFPKSIKLKHTLGNMIDYLEKDFEIKNNEKPVSKNLKKVKNTKYL